MSEGNPWPTTRWVVGGRTDRTGVFFAPGYLQVVGRARICMIRLSGVSSIYQNERFGGGFAPLNSANLNTRHSPLAFSSGTRSRKGHTSQAQVGGRLLWLFYRNSGGGNRR